MAFSVLTIMGLYMISANFDIFGGYRSFLVQSGSMEPSIMTGDIIIIHSQSIYGINDVVTFHDAENRIVSHRIIESSTKNNNEHFTTKGDANRSQDFDEITQIQIIGKVIFVVPKLGYLVAFSKSPLGLLTLAIIPAIMFAADELLKMKNA